MSLILSHLGCDAFGESREQEAAAKVGRMQFRASPILRFAGTWSGGFSATRRASIANWAYAAHSVDSAKLITALDRASADALADGGRTDPLRVYLQISLDGDVARGGVDIGSPISSTNCARWRSPRRASSSSG